MADRGSHRAPLGDATVRVNNSAQEKYDKRSRPQNPEPIPLRSRPTSSRSQERPDRTTSTTVASKPKKPLISHGSISKLVSGSHNESTVATDATEDKRYSQVSASSGASSNNRKTHIGPWELGKTLGKGSAARVRLARHQVTREQVAVKILAKNMTSLTAAGSLADLDRWDSTREEYKTQRHMPLSIEREVAILKLIDHPNIVRMHDIWENRSEIYIVLEYMDGGDFFSYINQRGSLTEFEMMGYFRQLLDALEYVHSFNICHRDLKPENILMKSNGVVKIADFGMAAIQQSPTHALRTSCGSPHYAAPELVSRKRYSVDKVDIWSLGVILYAALCGRLPFDDPQGNLSRLLAKAAKGVYVLPDFLSYKARDLISKMLQVDSAKRISIKEIWKHPLVQMYDDLDDLNEGERILHSRAEDRGKSVHPDQLDMQILRQLKSIWHTFSEKQIAMLLCHSEPNDQKLFYWLLLGYREKSLENYDPGLTYSQSDYHHLRPVNWKKKYTTAEFPSRYGRTPSRFTVISTVTTEEDFEEDFEEGSEDGTHASGTVQSYDPYKSSRIMPDVHASHAKIVIHRKASSAKHSARSASVRPLQCGSFRSSSTRSKLGKGGRFVPASIAIRASRCSLASIQSSGGASYIRPASRQKRGVDFSHIRKPSETRRHEVRASPSIAGDEPTLNPNHATPVSSAANIQTYKNMNVRQRGGIQSMADMSSSIQNGSVWNEEMREFSHSIAQDCDNAFNSSMLSPSPYLDPPTCDSQAAFSSLSLPMDTPAMSKRLANVDRVSRPWDSRPLPPTPPITASVRQEIKMAKRRAFQQMDNPSEAANADRVLSHLNCFPHIKESVDEEEPNVRIVSAPIYSQYSTQWGKDKIPLPSINERSRDWRGDNSMDRSRIVSAPARYGQPQTEDVVGLEYLARQKETIRFVDSPLKISDQDNATPAPLQIRAPLKRGITAHPQASQELNANHRYADARAVSQGPGISSVLSVPSEESIAAVAAYTKKKTSWYKRGSKDQDDMLNRASTSSTADHIPRADTNSSGGQSVPPTRKKNFTLAFWRHSRDEPEMQLELAGVNSNETPSPMAVRKFSYQKRAKQQNKGGVEARNIETHQSWLARLFRVKPAVKYLCFQAGRRYVRQEIAMLFRDWRRYGLRDVQVDKERNIIFARLALDNYLGLKEVSFAVEVMTVIEHGKNTKLCIARFTQEKGAASSFNKVWETVRNVFSSRNILVAEKRKAKMMLKTLHSA
ncbi:hypothetical protein F5Y16DRAFT_60460 [Xylariaceae sp. FL0255]|nr:hypothetical protein F5Y16DRAFT_60460 [Xylariaceae sp. FL0255]